MDIEKKYWPSEATLVYHFGVLMEFRAKLAWELIKTHPNISAIEDGEDTSGRSRLKLQTPDELVTRSFAIVDHFIEIGNQRGFFAETKLSLEEQAKAAGELQSIQEESRYNFMREKAKAPKG